MKALGSFRGTIEGFGVSVSSGGFPQAVFKVHAEQMYDGEAKEWADFAEFDWDPSEANDRDIMSYNILFGDKGATLNCDQVKKITNWNGESFTELAKMEVVGMKIQWRNELNTYKEETKVQVSWIDEYDAPPGGSVKMIDDKALGDLDAKFADMLAKADKAQSAKGAKGAASKAPATATDQPAEKPKRGRRSKDQIAKDKAAKEAAKTTATEATQPPAEPEIPAEPAMPGEDVGGVAEPKWLTEPCTQADAWADVNKMKPEVVTADTVSTLWLATIATVGGGKKQAELTEIEWSAVRANVLDEIGAEIPF